uniref:Uncharacterized protein n=1 Tax=viral metagenome TaxID=1070528 RepID=A0A6C0KDI7_9ZZZZ
MFVPAASQIFAITVIVIGVTMAMAVKLFLSFDDNRSGILAVDVTFQDQRHRFQYSALSDALVDDGVFRYPGSVSTVELFQGDPSNKSQPLALPPAMQPSYFLRDQRVSFETYMEALSSGNSGARVVAQGKLDADATMEQPGDALPVVFRSVPEVADFARGLTFGDLS